MFNVAGHCRRARLSCRIYNWFLWGDKKGQRALCSDDGWKSTSSTPSPFHLLIGAVRQNTERQPRKLTSEHGLPVRADRISNRNYEIRINTYTTGIPPRLPQRTCLNVFIYRIYIYKYTEKRCAYQTKKKWRASWAQKQALFYFDGCIPHFFVCVTALHTSV